MVISAFGETDHTIAWRIFKSQLQNNLKIAKIKDKNSNNFITNLKIEWNRKFTLSYAVFMLFFLGAPLGAVVKKGGLGWPVITAILIFLVYFMLTRAGEEMASNYSMLPITGMWRLCKALHWTIDIRR